MMNLSLYEAFSEFIVCKGTKLKPSTDLVTFRVELLRLSEGQTSRGEEQAEERLPELKKLSYWRSSDEENAVPVSSHSFC